MSSKDDNRSKQLNPQHPQYFLDRHNPLPKAKKLASEQQKINQQTKVDK